MKKKAYNQYSSQYTHICTHPQNKSNQEIIDTITDKWDLIKLRDFFTAMETVYQMKRQSTEQDKIFAKYTSNRVHIKLKIPEKLKIKGKKFKRLGQRTEEKALKRRKTNDHNMINMLS